jgi:glycosyltransferase involved in cell wall biosynthesis
VQHFVPTWEPGAVGHHVLEAHVALRAAGIDGNVYAGVVRDGLPLAARPVDEYARDARPGDVLLYQHAIGSLVADFVVDRPEPLVVDYHNVTPHEFFDAWDRPLADALDWGRRQLRALARRSRLGVADSHYNELELQSVGFAATTVVPVLADVRRNGLPRDERLCNELTETKRGADLLFVGRLAPNKAQHELVKLLAVYRRTFDPGARLWLVGGTTSHRYDLALARFVERANLADAVVCTGPVSDASLRAYYDAADVFVSLSRHEGFGVPLVEAMAHDLPVVARATTAVPETVGDAGVLVDDAASLPDVATSVARVADDDALRRALVARGRARVEHFSLANARRQLVDALTAVSTVAA